MDDIDWLSIGQRLKEHSENEIGEIAAAHGLIVDSRHDCPFVRSGLYFAESLFQEGLKPAEGAHKGLKGIYNVFVIYSIAFMNAIKPFTFQELYMEQLAKKGLVHFSDIDNGLNCLSILMV